MIYFDSDDDRLHSMLDDVEAIAPGPTMVNMWTAPVEVDDDPANVPDEPDW